MSLEDMFGISISDDDAAQLDTVRRIVEYPESSSNRSDLNFRYPSYRTWYEEFFSYLRYLLHVEGTSITSIG